MDYLKNIAVSSHKFLFMFALVFGPLLVHGASHFPYPTAFAQQVLDSLIITSTALVFMRAFYLKGRHDEATAKQKP